jgi:hypothetical protein
MFRWTGHLRDLHRYGKEHCGIDTPDRSGIQSLNYLIYHHNLPFSGYRIQRVVSPVYITINNRVYSQIIIGNKKYQRESTGFQVKPTFFP